jgi:hypothetical protein
MPKWKSWLDEFFAALIAVLVKSVRVFVVAVVASGVAALLIACGSSFPMNQVPPISPPSVEIVVAHDALSIGHGNQGSSTITTTVSGGFNSAITLSASGMPPGTTVSFDPNPISAPGSGNSTMTISVGSNTPTGTYAIIVTGNGCGTQQAATVSLTVTATVALSWNASTSQDVIGYNVYRATNPNGPYTELNTSLISDTSYTDQSVQSGNTYYYVATAVDSQGLESAYSNQATAIIP